jgi:hypothetical protein
MMDNPNPNTMPEADDTQQQQHDDANINMRLDAITQRLIACEQKVLAATAITPRLSANANGNLPIKGPRYE